MGTYRYTHMKEQKQLFDIEMTHDRDIRILDIVKPECFHLAIHLLTSTDKHVCALSSLYDTLRALALFTCT